MINELFNTLAGLNPSFRELYKKAKLKTANKTTFNELLSQLLLLYDENTVSFNLSDEEVAQLFRDLGYPYLIRDDVLKIIGAPHNWQQAISMLHWLAQVVEYQAGDLAVRPSESPVDLLCEPVVVDQASEDSLFDIVRKGIDKKVRVEELARNYMNQQE